MKKLLWLFALSLAIPAYAQRGGPVRPPTNQATPCASDVVSDGACPGYERTWCVNYTTDIIYACDPTDHTWHAVGSGGGGGGGGAVGFDDILGGTSPAGTIMVVGSGAFLTFNTGGTITANGLACTDCVTLGTETAGSYAAGDAEAGNATGVACTGECIDLSTEIADFTSAQFAAELSDETGTGAVVLAADPILTGAPRLQGFTSNRCARFDSTGELVPSTSGDCDSGDTGGGGGDGILINASAVTDGTGVDLIDGAGVDISFNSGTVPDQATFVTDLTEIHDITFGDGSTDASITHTVNVSSGTDPITTYGSSTIGFNVPLDVADQTAEPGNYDGIRDNDTAFTNDPTCANSGSSGELHILDSDETSADVWDLCDGTSLKFRLPTASSTTTHALYATATSGAAAYRAMATTDLPTTGTWTATTVAVDLGGGVLEVPNGAAPTLDATGEAGLDTTADQFCYYNGTVVKCHDPRQSLSVVLFSPTSSDDPLVFKPPYGMTITDIDCITGAATSAEVTVTECDSTGAGCAVVDSAVVCDANGAADDGSLTNPSIAAGGWVKVDVGTVTGTVGFVSVTVLYTIVRE